MSFLRNVYVYVCYTDSSNEIGFPFAFGIFQDYYRTHEPFEGSSKTAIIGTCATVNAISLTS